MYPTRYGRWTAVREYVRRWPCGVSTPYAHCVCDCGKERGVSMSNLASGRSVSCGCFRNERITGALFKHGKSHIKEYKAWQRMIDRCHNPSNPAYPNYGGRGISVCNSWRVSYDIFAGDMGAAPPGSSIDRINNDGNYEPTNCRWATVRQQGNNRRTNVWVVYGGEKMTMKQCAERANVSYKGLHRRLRAGKQLEEALSELK